MKKRKSLDEIYEILSQTADIIYLTQKDYLEVLNISKYYSNVINFSDFVILKTMQDKKKIIKCCFYSGFDKINGIERIC